MYVIHRRVNSFSFLPASFSLSLSLSPPISSFLSCNWRVYIIYLGA